MQFPTVLNQFSLLFPLQIAQIKQKIEDRFGLAFEADEQVLFYNGRELDDALTVDNLNIEAPNFIVVFVMVRLTLLFPFIPSSIQFFFSE